MPSIIQVISQTDYGEYSTSRTRPVKYHLRMDLDYRKRLCASYAAKILPPCTFAGIPLLLDHLLQMLYT